MIAAIRKYGWLWIAVILACLWPIGSWFLVAWLSK